VTTLRQRMIKDLTVRGLAENTHKSYLQAVTSLARYYNRSPDQINASEIQDYLIYLHEKRGLSWKSCNAARHGLRFFYRITLQQPDAHFYLPGAKEPTRLPQILNDDELVRLFTVSTNPKHRALLMTAYAAGLRASELCHLKVTDIDSTRMSLRVEQGKGNKDRYAPLSPRLLAQLRDYWRRARPSTQWLFDGHTKDRPMSRSAPTWIFNTALEKAGIERENGGIHTLRHNYATGLLEAGVELCVIQRLMGHSSIRSTMRYLHIAQQKPGATTSPLDLLVFPDPDRP
jgi:integrase/recombinase XerD